MTLQLKLSGDKVGPKLKGNMADAQKQINAAARRAMDEASERILAAGREDIRSGGKFTARWTSALQTKVDVQGTTASNLVLTVYFQNIPYALIFEYGGRINGKPLLWIPLPWSGTRVRAREYPGKLFRVNRKGKNPLLMVSTGKGQAMAVYVGVKSVFLRRRFHLRPIIKRVAAQMPALLRKAQRLAGK